MAHPRSRGEHANFPTFQDANFGSSPLARGTLIARCSGLLVQRLIPARAGNTVRRSFALRSWSAHPRSRGEHRYVARTRFFSFGSSPLARGTQHDASDVPALTGLIPARAGNTKPSCHRPDGPPGSSPLARGTRLSRRQNQLRLRLIPARAGNTFDTMPYAVP